MKKDADRPRSARQAPGRLKATDRREETNPREALRAQDDARLSETPRLQKETTLQEGAEARETVNKRNAAQSQDSAMPGEAQNSSASSSEGQERELKDYADEDIPQYLKQYISQHPSSKMAWYLLGKEYERQGKDGKARYCYARSEEIYDAFEMKSMLPESEDISSTPQEAVGTPNKKLKRTAWALLFIVLLLILPSSLDKSMSGEIKRGAAKEEGGASVEPEPSPSPDVKGGESGQEVDPDNGDSPRVILSVVTEPSSVSESAGMERWLPFSSPSQNTVWGTLKRNGPWTMWGEGVQAMAAMRPVEASGRYELEIFDRELCQCEPMDGLEARQRITEWMTEREELLVLQSALIGYYSLNGSPPAEMADLTGNYPDNLLSGTTTRMEAAFGIYKDKLFDENGQLQLPILPENGGPDKPVNEYTEVWTEAPLEIIVDKQNYRLALVSGGIVIRNYPVGLGGDRTPEGEFYISEKVVDPQGRKKREFGTRGMTLSDTLYAIHGTNQPSSMEEDRSLGCIRMLDEDVEELYGLVPMGTKVSIVKEGLPESIIRGALRLELPVRDNETNPGKIYEWLN